MNISQILLEYKAVSLSTEKPFRYTSGILSPIYCDNRILLTDPRSRKIITEHFVEIIKKNSLEFDVICGVATGAIAWGALVADALEKPFIYVRSEKKEHGKGQAVEGKLNPRQQVLIIEDLISTGGSSIKAIENIREAGGIVKECIAIFMYGMEKSQQTFKDIDCRLFTLTTLSELLKTAVTDQAITKEQQSIILDWIGDAANWGKKHGFE
ncbi:TPA: orotate phosphoribosyltransferase [Candidatus Woesearchaeota archaeon]|nr:orotate phosphoribosyltransferase [Candidatus Woesearchaeota archaeon]